MFSCWKTAILTYCRHLRYQFQGIYSKSYFALDCCINTLALIVSQAKSNQVNFSFVDKSFGFFVVFFFCTTRECHWSCGQQVIHFDILFSWEHLNVSSSSECEFFKKTSLGFGGWSLLECSMMHSFPRTTKSGKLIPLNVKQYFYSAF